jgi:NAD-dependent deacetylase
MQSNSTKCDYLVEKLLHAKHIVIFTGAGVSAESGVATFRDKHTGHWENHDPMELASPDGWKEDKNRVWAWYESRRAIVMNAEPNACHIGIANLKHALETRTGQNVKIDIVTQNIDDLHERAGSTNVIHLHGSLFAPRCEHCEEDAEFGPDPPDPNGTCVEPPLCTFCKHSIRPGVVWFGEAVPPVLLSCAREMAKQCDVMIIVGTSGLVYPANGIPMQAILAHKFVASINIDSSSPRGCSLVWTETAGRAFEEILLKIQDDERESKKARLCT